MKKTMTALLVFIATALTVQNASAARSHKCEDEAKLVLKYALNGSAYNTEEKRVSYSAQVTDYWEGEDNNGYVVARWSYDVKSSIGNFDAVATLKRSNCLGATSVELRSK